MALIVMKTVYRRSQWWASCMLLVFERLRFEDVWRKSHRLQVCTGSVLFPDYSFISTNFWSVFNRVNREEALVQRKTIFFWNRCAAEMSSLLRAVLTFIAPYVLHLAQKRSCRLESPFFLSRYTADERRFTRGSKELRNKSALVQGKCHSYRLDIP